MGPQPSGTVSLVCTDIEGSTRLLAELGTEEYRRALERHRRLVREAFGRYGGYEVDYEGDSFFYAFESAAKAVSAVREAMVALAEGPIRVRVGIHTGEPGLDPPKYVGMDVHRAARIMACAHGGQVVLSQATRELLDQEDGLRDLGEHRLKDLTAPLRLYQLGEGEFPPLRSLYRTNLPTPATTFLGRRRELAEVAALLERDDVRLLTLTGPGGTGKTRLALQAAAEASELFPDGVWWVPLAPLRDAMLVLPTIAETVEAKINLVAHVADRNMLLLLDNLEQLLDCAPALAELVATGSRLKLLITSREPLHVSSEREYRVSPLAREEAVQLFERRAAGFGSHLAEDAAVASICARLDDLPLGIELAAARVRGLSPGQILARLEQRLPLLTGGPRDAPERQRTLRDTIAWSYDLLDTDEQKLFAKLAVFAGGCTLESAELVCDADIDLLQSLLEKSLLRQTDERFWMLETIREYAAEALDPETRDSVRHRHAIYFLALAEEVVGAFYGTESDQLRHFTRMTDERENMRAALTWFDVRRDDQNLARLAVALYPYWTICGPMTEARSWLDRAVERAKETDELLRARALAHLANVEMQQRDIPLARLHAEAALRDSEKADELGTRLAANTRLAAMGTAAMVRRADGDVEGARELYRDAIALARSTNEAHLALLLNHFGEWAFVRGDIDEARTAWSESLVVSTRRRNELQGSSTRVLLALCDLQEGDHVTCLQRLDQAVAWFVRVGDSIGLRNAIHVLALLEADHHELERSARLLGVAEALEEQSGSHLDQFELVARARAEEKLLAAPVADRVEQARAEGRRASFDEAADFALECLRRNLLASGRP
jgi:predicted ATPase/class 3 adenylate cyclase